MSSAGAAEICRILRVSRAPRSQLLAFLDDLAGGTRIRIIQRQIDARRIVRQPEPPSVWHESFSQREEPEATTIFFSR